MSFSRISLRISIWYAAAFVLGALTLFFLTGYFLSTSLQSKDRELLEAKFQQYSALLEVDGVPGLKTRISSQKIPDASQFLVRLSDSKGKTLFFHLPEDHEAEQELLSLHDLEERLRQAAVSSNEAKDYWLSVPFHQDGDNLEVLSRPHSAEFILQIGKSTEDRDEIIERLTHIFLWILVPLSVLATGVGAFLSNRLLSPIRWLTQTVKSIRGGNAKARVPTRGNGDELDELGTLFNEMLSQNQRLIEGMKEALDHVAHDLRTPVMRLQVAAEKAIREAPSVEACKEALSDCCENSEVITKILDAIMEISEAEAGALSLKVEPLLLSDLVTSVIELYSFVAEDKGQTLEAIQEHDTEIVGDRTRLLRALANLVDNAIKYSPSDSRIRVRVGRDEKRVFLSVEDEGPGVAPHEVQRIWDKLYRSDKSRSTRGLGLGLSLVQAIARAHGGSAEVTPAHAGGSVFRISLPLPQG